MKTNRQNQRHSHRLRENTHSFHPPLQNGARNEKTTLATLLRNFNHNEMIKLVCVDEVAVHIQPMREVSRRSSRSTSRRTGRTVSNALETCVTLRQCLNHFKFHPEKNYVFSAKSKNGVNSRYTCETGEKHKNSSIFSKTPSETSLKQFSSSKKSSAQKQSGLLDGESMGLESNGNNMKRFLSQKQLGNADLMFTVEELKQSVQSQARESLKQNHQKQNRNGFNFNTLDIKAPTMSKHYLERLKKPQNQQLRRVQVEAVPMEVIITETKEEQICQQQIPNEEIKPLLNQQCKAGVQPIQAVATVPTSSPSGFSFASNLMRGLMQQDSSCVGQASFKIVGDSELQAERNRGKSELDCGSVEQIDELSSIFSNAREEKKGNNQEIDSIKYDLEDINKCCTIPTSNRQSEGKKKNEVANNVEVQRLDLNSIAERRENEVYDESIQITEKKEKESDNVQFTVRYNVRFLQRKNQGTEVVRLSPLRFRRKEQMVQQLVRAKVVAKESDSINIV